MTRYLIARAAAYRLLIDTALIDRIEEGNASGREGVDLSRVLGGDGALISVICSDRSRTPVLGVDATLGLIDLAEHDFAPLPDLIFAAAGDDVDAVTRAPVDGAHGFRLRLAHSSAAVKS